MPRQLTGPLVGILAAVTLGGAMAPIRSHLAIATAALVLVVPVVAGATIGGWTGGLISVAAGFLVYDFAFIPPYDTLTAGSAQNWIALAVYVIIMVVVARLVVHLHDAQEAAESHATNTRRLLDLSELLLMENAAIAQSIVIAAQEAFHLDDVALLQPVDGRLEVLATAGDPISETEYARLQPEAHRPVPLTTARSEDPLQTLALVSSGRPIGLLVLRNVPSEPAVREALPILANHLAIALERSELATRIRRAEMLEEIDRLRQSLVGAVSHDLRTPLATIKVASSTLVESADRLSTNDRDELYGLIDLQADRLSRLVNNLLDMTRIQSGALEVRPKPTEVGELVRDALGDLGSALGTRHVELDIPDGLPLVDADPLLIGQVLVNLLDNANRHAPPGSPVRVEVSRPAGGRITIAVVDAGPGVAAKERESVFETFVRFDTGGRSGLGLAIAKAFTEAHGEHIWVEDAAGGGARFVFTLAPAATPVTGAR
jgi:two-component system sensor histidine kinase KdpD